MPKKWGSTTEQVYRQIKNNIVEGVFSPGERLATAKLATQCNVSRTPVREALKKLECDGLVRSSSNVGAMIRKVDIGEVCDIYEIRAGLEGIAIRKLIKNGVSKSLINRLRAFCKKRKDARNFEQLEKNDIDFHMEICRASKSTVIIDVIENHMILLVAFGLAPRIVKKHSLKHDTKSNIEHEQIVDAIEQKDTKLAVSLIQRHIASARKILLETFKQ